MARIIQCPQQYHRSNEEERTLFIAGGITGTSDWQQTCTEFLANALPDDVVLLNPRRSDFDITDPSATDFQIRWEYQHIHDLSDAILFWFTPETMCPITLYELGKWSMTDLPLFVATDPKYARRADVVIQTSLIRPDVIVHDNIEDMVNEIVEHHECFWRIW